MNASYAIAQSSHTPPAVSRYTTSAASSEQIPSSIFRPEFRAPDPDIALRFTLKDTKQTLTVRVPVYLGNVPIPTSSYAAEKKEDLISLWSSIRSEILVNNLREAVKDIPELDAPAEKIYDWIQNNKPALARVDKIICHNLHEIPDLCAFTGLTQLSISGSFTTVSPDAFKALTKLQVLSITHSQLSSLPLGIFDHLSSLHYLDLNHNCLNALPQGLLDKVSKLWSLNLSHNQLRELPENLLHNQLGLQSVDFSNNLLSALPARLFHADRRFSHLNGFPNLQSVALCNNPFRELSLNLFDQTKALQFLSIDRETQCFLDPNVIAKLAQLQTQCQHSSCGKGARLLLVEPNDSPTVQETWNRTIGQHATIHLLKS